jgi:transposase InsO family protein
MKYASIQKQAQEFPLERLCQTLGVSESGYYAWLKREPSERAKTNLGLVAHIRRVWGVAKGLYGVPCIHAELLVQGLRIGRKRVARLMQQGIIPSMSGVGQCWDNAPMESFWATLKRECADRVFDSFDQTCTEIFHYIVAFYNRLRRHSALGYLSPLEFEQAFRRDS